MATGARAQGSWLDPIRDLDGRGRTREALSRLEGQPQRLSGDPEARLLRGVLLAKLGRTVEARELYQRLIVEHPQLPEAYNNLAVMHAAAGDYETAIEILKQGLATHPSYRTTYDNLTKVYGKLAGEAYSKALGDERIDDEPLRLALINGMAAADLPASTAAAEPTAPAAVAAPAASTVPLPVPPAPAEASGPAAEPPPVAAETSAAAAAAQVAPQPGPESESEIWQTVQSWADAWAGQRPDRYLSFYAAEFQPPAGGSRAEWEELRRRRLSAPTYVNISLALLEIEQPAADRALARFVQAYESDRFTDTVTKTLELIRTAAGWRIVGESVE